MKYPFKQEHRRILDPPAMVALSPSPLGEEGKDESCSCKLQERYSFHRTLERETIVREGRERLMYDGDEEVLFVYVNRLGP